MQNYIIFDLEWNQGDAPVTRNDKTLTFEIVEIGAVKLNERREKIGEFSRLIRPQIHKHMHKITGKLIHLTMEDLMDGDTFPDVANDFLDWCGESPVFCSWGPIDLTEFQRNLDFYDMPLLSDRPIAFYDVQKLYSLAYDDGKLRKALETVVDELNLEKDIPFHRALADAEYTARIFAKMNEKVLQRVSYDTFVTPKNRKQEIKKVFDSYYKYISREFETKEDVLADREVMSNKCYLCHKNIKRLVKWFTPNSKHYYSVAYCDKHGYMKSKVRIKKAEDGNLFVVKTCKFISPDDVEEMKEKLKRIKKKHKD